MSGFTIKLKAFCLGFLEDSITDPKNDKIWEENKEEITKQIKL